MLLMCFIKLWWMSIFVFSWNFLCLVKLFHCKDYTVKVCFIQVYTISLLFVFISLSLSHPHAHTHIHTHTYVCLHSLNLLYVLVVIERVVYLDYVFCHVIICNVAVTFYPYLSATRTLLSYFFQVTTDWLQKGGVGCTEQHTGTSAAAPLVA